LLQNTFLKTYKLYSFVTGLYKITGYSDLGISCVGNWAEARTSRILRRWAV